MRRLDLIMIIFSGPSISMRKCHELMMWKIRSSSSIFRDLFEICIYVSMSYKPYKLFWSSSLDEIVHQLRILWLFLNLLEVTNRPVRVSVLFQTFLYGTLHRSTSIQLCLIQVTFLLCNTLSHSTIKIKNVMIYRIPESCPTIPCPKFEQFFNLFRSSLATMIPYKL